MKTLPVALQVYSVRDAAEQDFAGTMKKIKDMGYDGVELAGLYGNSSEKIKKVLDEIGLTAISAHVPFADLKADIDSVIDTYLLLGCKYIAVPYLDEENRPNAAGFIDTLKEIDRIGAACTSKGITLLYHNHDFEFVKMADGSFGLDYMYNAIPAEHLKTELDVCWVKVAGQDPVEYIGKYAGRSPVVHLKDFYKEGRVGKMYELIGIDTKENESRVGTFEFRPLGQGLQDIPPILEASVKAGANWVVVEQDQSIGRTPIEAVEMSRKYLAKLSW